MAQEQGAAGSGDAAGSRNEKPDAAGTEVPDSPEFYGNNGLVGEGRYRLTRRLGRGGMAEVFAAEDVRLGRTVAVKLLRSDLAEEPVAKARFTREAQSVAGLNHHAVVAVYDSGEEQVGANLVPYMVMELVTGRTIRELLFNADEPPAQQALVIVSGVLEALAYSHQQGIVHRDIKPANVIITDTGSVKVMDFGIARALHGAAQTMTATGMVMGTPQYLSPEQALGKTVDVRSDLYAVGCLLFELLAMRPPFVGETPLAVVYQHVQDQPKPPSQVSESAPPELDGLVMRALTKDPDDRFQSAEEMRGVVQYALRMLEEHGTHTGGLWNTGSTDPSSTPAMGTPATAAHGADAPTSQLGAPLLLGDQAGGGSGGGDGDGHHGGRRGGRGKMVLVALLALVAIGTGVLVAANFRGDDDADPNPPGDSSPSQTEEREESPSDSPSETEEEPEEPEDDGYYPPPDSDTSDDWEPGTPSETDPSTPDRETGESEPEEPDPSTPTESTPEEPTPSDDPEPSDPPGDDDGGDDEGWGDGGDEGDEGGSWGSN